MSPGRRACNTIERILKFYHWNYRNPICNDNFVEAQYDKLLVY